MDSQATRVVVECGVERLKQRFMKLSGILCWDDSSKKVVQT